MTPGRDETDEPQEPAPTREIDRGGGEDDARFVGETLGGRYRIEARLGAGAMGAVYLAEHVRIGRRDAIKLLDPELADDEDAWARFTREARNASHINHPNVCTVYDFGETEGGLPYIAMEYVEGETLTDLMEREGPLPPRRVLELAEQILDALDAAHARGIVHRDLKPENIMLARDEHGRGTVKVVDFGIAKAVQDEEGRQDITREGFAVGTPRYVSPEQVAGGEVDRRSDLYALAIVLYELLTGRLPFMGDSWREVMTKRLSEEPTPLRATDPDLEFGVELERVVDRALSREPEDRYEDAEAMRRALRQAVRGGGSGGATVPGTELIDVDEGGPGLLDPSAWPAVWRRAALGLLLVAGAGGVAWAGMAALGGGADGTGAPGGPAGADGSEAPAGELPPGRQLAQRETGGADAAGDGGPPAAADTSPAGDGTDGTGAPGESPGAGSETDAAGAGSDGTNGGDAGTPVGTDGGRPAAGEDTDGDGAGTGDGTDGAGADGSGGAWPLAGLSTAEVEDRLLDMQGTLAAGSPGPGRLAGIEDTARMVWEREDQPDVNRAAAAYARGLVMLERGDTAEAVVWIERATRLDPTNSGYQTRLDYLPGGGR